MGLLNCGAEAAIATCDSYNFKKTSKQCQPNRPFEIREYSYSDLQSATNGFSQENLLGKGSHGFVYRADLLHGRSSVIAAVKITKQSETKVAAAGSTAENEIELLSRIYHPRLVNLIGYGLHLNRKKLLVVEFMPNGSLYELLHCSTRPPGLNRRVRFALQVAKAVRFCHSSNPPIIHRDIKSSNVLIDEKFNARLGDFGLALRGLAEDVATMRTPPAGTLGYLDPGYLAPGDLSPKSDVFSFGILLLEIISGRYAIDMNYSPPSVVDWAVPLVKSGDYAGICDPRIQLPEDDAVIRQLSIVAASCVRKSATKRPGMAEVVNSLKSIYKRVRSPVWSTMRRRVVCILDTTRVAARYEPLDDSVEAVRISRARRLSTATSVESVNRNSAIGGKTGRHVAKAKSIGSFAEIGYELLDKNAGSGAKKPTVRLNKSRSMGMLTCGSGPKLMNKSRSSSNLVTVQLVRNRNVSEWEESELLIGRIRVAQLEPLQNTGPSKQ
ncbi:unnamed protein product [Cuscuta epithymum]|uniref:Protein kinase domain-containing protein n=1 Tax=Cuscuta epithymum TaxID=186058 RepID=A0AAV0DM99_9ASTE|nr:unnamed protein product [Cuscuta epithymum]